jgi:hypothetical protein
MSEQTGSSTNSNSNAATIYIPLLNEGITVHRPTRGIMIGDGLYEVLPTDDYAVSGEEWEFPPGSIVECVVEMRNGKDVLIAKQNAAVTGRGGD